MNTSDISEIAKKALAALWRAAVITVWVVRELLRTAWRIARGPLIATLNVVAALIVLFEEWGWRPLSELLGRLAKFAPIAALESWIAGLPPYAAFVVIALPSTLLLPLKFVSLWLLANGHYATAMFLFLAAKVASTALIARVFLLTKPALMRLSWFAQAYHWFVPWKDALFAEIRASWVWRYGRMLKTRVRIETNRIWARMEPAVSKAWVRWTGRSFPSFGRKARANNSLKATE